MSWVTEVAIITGPPLRDDDAATSELLVEVNALFEGARAGFSEINMGAAGGNKAWAAIMFAGSFNYLDLEGLLVHLRTKVRWDEYATVQVLIRDDQDSAFRLETLRDPC